MLSATRVVAPLLDSCRERLRLRVTHDARDVSPSIKARSRPASTFAATLISTRARAGPKHITRSVARCLRRFKKHGARPGILQPQAID